MKHFVGHLSFIYDIVNKHTPSLFKTSAEAATAVNQALREVHEVSNAKKREK